MTPLQVVVEIYSSNKFHGGMKPGLDWHWGGVAGGLWTSQNSQNCQHESCVNAGHLNHAWNQPVGIETSLKYSVIRRKISICCVKN
jgi:hypothetical protein